MRYLFLLVLLSSCAGSNPRESSYGDRDEFCVDKPKLKKDGTYLTTASWDYCFPNFFESEDSFVEQPSDAISNFNAQRQAERDRKFKRAAEAWEMNHR